MITMTAARDVKVGDTFSTDGGVVLAGVLCSGGGAPDEVCLQYQVPAEADLPAVVKWAYVEPERLLPIWRPDN